MIDLWVERLPGPEHGDMLAALSTSERARAGRMRSTMRRARYVIAHDWLHNRLGEMLELAPAKVRVVYDERGAPSVEGQPMRISFSHHHDVVALAVSTGASVGTDVLEIPFDARFVADTALVLSPLEIAFVHAAPPHLQGAAFAQCWTRKEAYAKCRGYGLTRDLPKITLTPWTAGQREATLWSLELERVVVAVAIAATGSPDARLHGSTPIANGSMFHCQIRADEPSDARPLARRHARRNRSLHGDELVEITAKRESLADHG